MLNLKKTTPKTVRDVCKLIGLLSYYRHYIQDFSRIAKPIYDLLSLKPSTTSIGDGANHEKQEGEIATATNKCTVTFQQAHFWANHHQEALEYLIDCLTKPPVMAYPDFISPFILHTDASEVGLSAVLYQRQDGKPHVIAYGSCTLTPA